VAFRTSYIDDELGQEVGDGYKIAWNYVKGRFFVDLLASIPFDIFNLFIMNKETNSIVFQLFGLLKLIRVLRLSKLIAYLNLKNDMKMSLKLVKFIFFLIMYLHIVACLWFYIVRQDEEWIPPLNELSSRTTEIYDEKAIFQYFTSLYYSVLLLAGNDMFPQGELQLCFATFMLLAAAIINANIFGNIAVLLQQLNRKSTNFQARLENATSTMKGLTIPEKLQKRVQNYLTSTQKTLDQQEEFNNFIKLLSPTLKLEVTRHIFQSPIKSNPVFENEEKSIELIIKSMYVVFYYPEQDICIEGEDG
jgi:hypothetical protein